MFDLHLTRLEYLATKIDYIILFHDIHHQFFSSNDTENHIKLQPCQNMMLHSSEPSLLERNTTRDITIERTGRAITNSNTRDASTSTVPKAKHIISQTTSVQLMANDNQSLGVVEVSQSHNESYKPSAPEESRFQNSR